ncbi:ABC transporter permease [Paenibacillus puerhi]|uniref:ABC transporter permease n=1 Tax=Paenibacillus puerhi TaxID=2692622 RepID=UPI001357FB02|nr:ABC transporter permease [Paenibacillus puerhi]
MKTIILMTWRELLRKKVVLVTALMTVLFCLIFAYIGNAVSIELRRPGLDKEGISFLLESYGRGSMILSLGFFFGSFVVAFLSIFSSFSVISGEAEQAVLLSVLPRPLPRTHWYAGRWLGFVSFGIAYAALLFMAILMITSLFAAIPRSPEAILISFLLFAAVVPLLVSVSMLGSCLFSAIGNGVVLTMLYGAGWLGGMIDKVAGTLGIADRSIEPLLRIAGLISLLMPADSLQKRMLTELLSLQNKDVLVNVQRWMGLFNVGEVPTNAFLGYAFGYTVCAFALGMWLFRRKDF